MERIRPILLTTPSIRLTTDSVLFPNSQDIMKKAVLLFAGALLLVGCAKETDTQEAITPGKTYTITAAVDDNATRTIANYKETDNRYHFVWADDEQIAVLPQGQTFGLPFTVEDKDNGTFSYTAPEGSPTYDSFVLAVTPQNALDEVILDGDQLQYRIQYSGHYYQNESNAIMVAGAPTLGIDGNQHFSFKQIGAVVKVTYANVPAGTHALVFSTPDNCITGRFRFSTPTGVTAEASKIDGFMEEEAGHEATVEFRTDPTETQASVDFFVPIPTGSYQTFSVKLKKADGQIISGSEQTFSAPSTFNVVRADMILCPVITLTPAPVDQYFVKVMSLDQIVDGAQYVIGAWFNDVKGDAFYAIPANPTVNSGKINGKTVAVSTSGIAIADAAGFEWTLSKDGDFWTLMDGSKYLYHSNGGNSGTNLGYGATASFLWSVSEGGGDYGLFKFAGVADGEAKSRGLLFNGTVFGGYALTNYGKADYPGIDLYVLAGEDQRADVTLSFENASYELSIGTEGYDNFSGQVVTTTPAGVTGVKYALTGAAIGSIDEDTGAITLDGTTVGEATITAAFAGNSTYKPATSVSYTITVDDSRNVTLDWTYPEEGAAATKDGINAVAGVTTYGLGSDYAESHAPYRIKFDTTDDYIQVKTDVAIGEVTVAYKKIGGPGNSTLKIQESVDGEDFTDVEVLTLTGVSGATSTVSTTNAFDSDSRYVKILFNKVDNVGIGGITINKVDNTPRFTVESPLEATAAADDYTVNIIRKFFTGAIIVTVPQDCNWIEADNVAANATSFEVSVSANTGSARTATLTLSADGVASQQLVVNQAGVEPGTETNPFTVAQALEFIDDLGDETSQTVWVTGIVSKVDRFLSSYHSITYFISDNGNQTDELEVYSGKGLNNANFTDITNIAVGDKLIVKGTLKNYNGTPEFTQNSIITSIVSQAPRYTVSLLDVTNGTIATSATSVGAQGVVTLTATPDTGYELDEWTVKNLSTNQTITVTENKFIMPAANVSVYATFTEAQSGGEVTVSKTMNQIVSANNYTVSSGSNATCYTSFMLDDNITVSTSGNPNCGSFWGSSPIDWRLYQAQNGDITISVANSKELVSVKITYSVSNSGTLKSGTTTISSGSTQSVSGTSVTYTVGNTGDKTNGQVKVTAIEVTYR